MKYMLMIYEDDADAADARAIGRETDPAVRRFLQHRRAALDAAAST